MVFYRKNVQRQKRGYLNVSIRKLCFLGFFIYSLNFANISAIIKLNSNLCLIWPFVKLINPIRGGLFPSNNMG